MQLVGFIIRIYHDARSSECQIREIVFWYTGLSHWNRLCGSLEVASVPDIRFASIHTPTTAWLIET